ncbi:MAG: peptide chain release factor 2 [Anaerolineae bacterium]|nr:peptide chain release factor 2 [Anaerolineae bacterium]
MDDLVSKLTDLNERIEEIQVRLDFPDKARRIEELERQAAQPEFWDEPSVAQEAMQDLSNLKFELEEWQALHRRTTEALELLELAMADEDTGMAGEIEAEAARIARDLARREFQLRLSGPHDRGPAILGLHAGAGGTDAQDFVGILMRMYLRWAEQQGYQTEVLDSLRGQEAGYKSVTISVRGPNAYGYLKAERGVHRLVRLSPFDEAHRRHTSFVLVEVVPELNDDIEVKINADDLKIDVFKASGAGGQHVQKNSTAVRILHEPTGIIVSCQNERSQAQNREVALKILRGRLYDLEQQKLEEEQARLKGKHITAGWGNQIRSYVMHPYHMVKDLRTEYETGNVEAVLDGQIQEFMEAFLQTTIGD